MNDDFVDYGKRTILLSREIDDEAAKDLYRAVYNLTKKSKEPFTLLLNTVGGDIDAGLHIYDILADSDSHVTIHVTSRAWSMGSIILQAGDSRTLHHNATVMLHTGTLSYPEAAANDVLAAIDLDRRQTARCDDILFKRLKAADPRFSKARLNALNDKGNYLSAERALALGLVDRIQRS